MEFSKELIAASTIPMLLAILNRGENYGYAIIKEIEKLSRGELGWSEGMLYPVLHRLEEDKMIESLWKESETGRKRKYYRILKKGKEYLIEQTRQWEFMTGTMKKIKEAHACSF